MGGERFAGFLCLLWGLLCFVGSDVNPLLLFVTLFLFHNFALCYIMATFGKTTDMNAKYSLVQSNRNYTSLLCYQKALVIYDLTYHFCERFLDKRDRTYDQMIQAARSGKQNIVEGVVDLSTSFEMVIKLLNVSRGSLAELKEDYLDYIRTRRLRLWEDGSAEKEAMRRLGIQHSDSAYFLALAEVRGDETIANMVLVLLYQAEHLIYNYIKHLEERFVEEGGFREKMYHARVKTRGDR